MFIAEKLKTDPDYIAPDGAKIFILLTLKRGGLCICELPIRKTTKAVKHITVDEIWFFLSGHGKVWRKIDDKSNVEVVSKDICITIPVGCHFQFKNTGDEPHRFVISTMPTWPGEDEAIMVDDYWDLRTQL